MRMRIESMNAHFQVEKTVMPYLTAMSEFRDAVRELARSLKATDILKVCDNLRDEILPNIGVRLEDREGMCDDVSFSVHSDRFE